MVHGHGLKGRLHLSLFQFSLSSVFILLVQPAAFFYFLLYFSVLFSLFVRSSYGGADKSDAGFGISGAASWGSGGDALKWLVTAAMSTGCSSLLSFYFLFFSVLLRSFSSRED
jgi:hypothetical protein